MYVATTSADVAEIIPIKIATDSDMCEKNKSDASYSVIAPTADVTMRDADCDVRRF